MEIIKEKLAAREEIVVAVIHGGFVESKIFRDIDIAIYTNHRIAADEAPTYIDTLREELEKALGVAIDIQLLEYAPPYFVYKVLSRGITIIEKIPGLVPVLRIHAFEDFRRLRKIEKHMNVEQMSSSS